VPAHVCVFVCLCVFGARGGSGGREGAAWRGSEGREERREREKAQMVTRIGGGGAAPLGKTGDKRRLGPSHSQKGAVLVGWCAKSPGGRQQTAEQKSSAASPHDLTAERRFGTPNYLPDYLPDRCQNHNGPLYDVAELEDDREYQEKEVEDEPGNAHRLRDIPVEEVYGDDDHHHHGDERAHLDRDRP